MIAATHKGNDMAQGNLRAAGLIALVTGHCAGMLDLVALPVWVGALVRHCFRLQGYI